MKDSLKKFIQGHREKFDTREPGHRVWKAIQAGLPAKQISLWNNVSLWRIAASVFFILSVTLWVSGSLENGSQREQAQLQGEFKDLEKFYSEQIADKVELISDIQGFEDEKFAQDVEKLEAMYQVLREQMRNNPTQQVKDALILNLLVRIDLLNQQIKNLEDSKKSDAAAESLI